MKALEDHFKAHWVEHPRFREPLTDFVTMTVPYTATKLFLLSILWRASVSTLADFRKVRLGKFEARARELIATCAPGEVHEFPTYAGLIRHKETGLRWDTMMMLPLRIRFEGRHAYRFMFAGTIWTVVVSGDRDILHKDLSLHRDGTFRLVAGDHDVIADRIGAIDAVASFPLSEFDGQR